PVAARVSAMRQGVTGTKRRPAPGGVRLAPCTMAKLWLPTVIAPERWKAVGLASMLKFTCPLPVPVPEVMCNQVVEVPAVQAQPEVLVTETESLAAAEE